MSSMYYEVAVASASYKGREFLTYDYAESLPIGSLVEVPVRKQSARAVVMRRVSRPTFKTKPISSVLGVTLPTHLVTLIKQLLTHYPASTGEISQLIAPSYAVARTNEIAPLPALPALDLPPLTNQQQTVIKQITDSTTDRYFLHGETGSGKTRILIERAYQALLRRESALILSPEIGLSSQLAQDFTAVFGERVVVAHSQLTVKQRREIWQTALLSPEPRVFIGPRSALFLPIHQIGFIGVDEAHEAAYKQESTPYYHAVPVAALLANITKSELIFASATPGVATYANFSKNPDSILQMREVAVKNATESKVLVVDMRAFEKRTKSEIISDPAIEVMKDSLQHGQQCLVFLNRRGSATLVFCQLCSWRASCPVCDAQLTYHGDSHQLLCHVCGHHQPIPTSCPECGNPEILYKGAGTKAVYAEVERLFPSARLARFDADNKKSESLYQNLAHIRAGGVDIVIGTQMIAKGLDLPQLGCVVVVSADNSLLIPDFSSEERTYQQLHQVLGRVGRGHVAGTAVVQTYQPDNPVIQAAVHRDWRRFYQGELHNRQTFKLPPYRYLAQVSFSRTTAAAAERYGQQLKQQLQATAGISILGPAPHFHEKDRGRYRWHIILRATSRTNLVQTCLTLPNDCKIDIDPISLL